MIIEIEDIEGNTLMAFETDITHISRTLNCSLADVDVDDIFDTNQDKIRIQQEEKI